MSEQEKKDHPFWKTTEGYLKTYDYKEAWRIAWDKASQEEKDKVKALKNFDAQIFQEITGIDIETSFVGQEVEVKINGKTFKAKITEEK